MSKELQWLPVINPTFLVNDRVVITAPGDDTDVMHHGTIVALHAYAEGDWYTVRVDGEAVTHEWPLHRIWPEVRS